jgi:hypothetical protein
LLPATKSATTFGHGSKLITSDKEELIDEITEEFRITSYRDSAIEPVGMSGKGVRTFVGSDITAAR